MTPGTRVAKEDALPTDWGISLIKRVAKIVRGASPRPAGSPKYFNGSFLPWITVADVTRGMGIYLSRTASRLTAEGAKFTRVLDKGTLILTNSGATLGVPKITTIRAGANDGIAALVDLEGIDQLFLYYVLQSKTRFFRERLAPGIGQPNLNTELIGSVAIPIPPAREQREIAAILSEFDAAFERIFDLIRLKYKLKKALMQRLLSGKRRLRGFLRPWETRKLGDLFDERNETGRCDLPLLSITGDRGVVRREEVNRKDTSNEDKMRYKRICPGDVGYNTMRMWQGVSALSALEGVVSPAYTVCRPTQRIDGRFAAYFFKLPSTVNLFYRFSQGLVDDTRNLKFHHFAQVPVRLPQALAEQCAIADVLNTADREIELLERQLELFQKQKRGLMQKLLTGQVRVKGVGDA